jgi:hypothetical protein
MSSTSVTNFMGMKTGLVGCLLEFLAIIPCELNSPHSSVRYSHGS